jgi:tetratricopeptide (TPR) repeat protein
VSGRRRRRTALSGLVLLVAGTIGVGAARANSSRPGAALEPAGAEAATVRPLALTREMQAWVASIVRTLPPETSDLDRLRNLQRSLTLDEARPLVDSPARTPTAAEAFALRRTDCVGFALLLVTLARAAGVEARFVLTSTFEGSDLAGSLRIRRAHLSAGLAGRLFDFAGERELLPDREAEVDDRTALALFFSNRGAQRLAAGWAAESVEWLYRAVRYDPSLSWVWTNLGVALRRNGDAEGAVLAYEMALRIDSRNESARRNLEVVRTRKMRETRESRMSREIP